MNRAFSVLNCTVKLILLAAALLIVNYTCAQAPVISSFSPTSGPTGTIVTIKGNNFNASAQNNTVYFGAEKATVVSAAATQLAVTVPIGATCQPFTVTANGLTAYSVAPFIVTFNGPALTANTFKRTDFEAGLGIENVVLMDFDGDGKPDIAGEGDENDLCFLKNNSLPGTPSFSLVLKKVSLVGSGIAVGDFDGDGKPDVVVSNFDDGSISIYKNTSTIGQISFANAVNFTAWPQAYRLVVADFNGDGKPDIAVTSNDNIPSMISVFTNTTVPGGPITFLPRQDLPVQQGAREITAADIDGDGKPDLIVSCQGGNVSVFRNTSAGGQTSFAPKVDYTMPAVSATEATVVIDFDGDGKPDMVVTNNNMPGSISLLENTSTPGTISFGPMQVISTRDYPYGICAADIDGDGKPDLALTNQLNNSVAVLVNTSTPGHMSFTNIGSFATNIQPRSVVVGDMDGDGRPDLVVGNEGASAVTLLMAATPPIIQVGTLSGAITSCVGTASASPDIQQFTVSGTHLIGAITVRAPTGFEVSVAANSGYAGSLALPQSGSKVAAKSIYVRSSANATAGNNTGNIVLSTPGGSNQSIAVQATVNALPVINTVSDQTVFNGITTSPIPFSGTANTYTWTNDNPGIGLPASGTGDIASFTPVNTGNSPIIANITVTPESNAFAYIASAGGDVSIINTTTSTYVKDLPVYFGAGVAVSPDGTRAYITSQNSSVVSVINTASNTVITSFSVGKFPYGLAVSPDGSKLYVANQADNNVSVINTTTYKLITTVGVGANPYGVAVSPDGTRVYITNLGGVTVSVINAANNSLINTINVGSAPIGVVVSPDGSVVYVANTLSADVSEINTHTGIVSTIPVGSHPVGVVLSPDGKNLYVTNSGDATVWAINTSNNAVLAKIPVGSGPEGISITPDGQSIYVVTEISDEVWIINTNSYAVTAKVTVSLNPVSLGNFITDGTGCPGTPKSFTITVNPTPTITTAGVLAAVNTVYGTPSSSSSFTVTAVNLSAGITVTPPAGFELSADNINFSNTLTLGGTGNLTDVPVYIRLAAVTNVGGYSGNVSLSSPGTSVVTVTMPVSNVSQEPITLQAADVNKSYGTALVDGVSSAGFNIIAGTLQNGNTISSVSFNYGTGAEATANVGTYAASRTPLVNTGGNGFLSSNYTITYVAGNIIVTPVPLTITATDIHKPYGAVLTGGTGFTAFTSTGLQNQETIGSISIAYGAGSAASDAPGVYQGAIIPSLPAGGTFSAGNYTITYQVGNIIVDSPVSIQVSGALTALNTTYGTPSPSLSFMVTGNDLPAGILVSPPAGFEVSIDNINFYSSLTIGSGGNIGATPVYVRLGAITAAGVYSGDILLSSNGQYNESEAIPNSTVIAVPLTITADNKTRAFGAANPELTASYAGFVNLESAAQLSVQPVISTIAVTNSLAGEYPITVSDAESPNYIITFVPGILTIQPQPLASAIPNAFTPNGDGINDVWDIPALTSYTKSTVKIYDRWGSLVFHSVGYAKPWDGTMNGKELPTGTYYYVIELAKNMAPLSGYVVIIR